MRRKLIAIVVLLCGTALAHKHPPVPDADYQDGVITRLEMVAGRLRCSSSSNGEVDAVGNIHTNGNGGCRQQRVEQYTVEAGGQRYALEPAPSFSLGLSAKHSVLYLQPMGTHVQVRTEKDKVFVKVGDRESAYHVVGLESVSK